MKKLFNELTKNDCSVEITRTEEFTRVKVEANYKLLLSFMTFYKTDSKQTLRDKMTNFRDMCLDLLWQTELDKSLRNPSSF